MLTSAYYLRRAPVGALLDTSAVGMVGKGSGVLSLGKHVGQTWSLLGLLVPLVGPLTYKVQ